MTKKYASLLSTLLITSSILAMEASKPNITVTDKKTYIVCTFSNPPIPFNKDYSLMYNPATQSLRISFLESPLLIRIKEYVDESDSVRYNFVLLDGPSAFDNAYDYVTFDYSSTLNKPKEIKGPRTLNLTAVSPRFVNENKFVITIPKDDTSLARSICGDIVKVTPRN